MRSETYLQVIHPVRVFGAYRRCATRRSPMSAVASRIIDYLSVNSAARYHSAFYETQVAEPRRDAHSCTSGRMSLSYLAA